MNKQHTNRLVHATSPYLLQHAHNPVDWYEWGAEALDKAKKDDKPLLVSIGYSSCHWCHVMERESFESPEIAKVMNDFFVCIKVDREERPDIDQIYMEAVQALGIHGGWPLNVFITPDQKPFFGGTYFTPQAWVQVLTNINRAFTANRQQLEETGEQLSVHLAHSDVSRFMKNEAATALIPDVKTMYAALEKHFDKEWGGMDRAPKFVMPSVWRFLLRYYHLTGDASALRHVQRTLDKVAEGGIYDQIRGGFARYAVDGYWFAPHFEKMLYDNGQLLSLYAEAYTVTKDESYKKIVYESFEWLTAEMTHPDGGFFSALDADSEGDEGKYYVWTQAELQDTLGSDADIISEYFQVTPGGNWEHGNNILNRKQRDEDFLKQKKIAQNDWQRILEAAKEKLLRRRAERVRPGLDDKILTAWNAITVIGLMDAFAAFDDPRFVEAAQRNMRFILSQVADGEILYRSFKGKRSSTMGFLDDYAFTVHAMIKLYQGTFDESWISSADALTTHALEHFYDVNEKFFYYTSNAAEKLISRKKEIFDNVIPSSNAVMAQNLYALGTILDREEWKRMAEEMTSSLNDLIRSEPNYMSQWAIAVTEIKKGFKEVLLVGRGVNSLRAQLQREFHPYVLLQGATSTSALPLFEGKTAMDGQDTIYVCEQKTCQLPVHSLEDARKQINAESEK